MKIDVIHDEVYDEWVGSGTMRSGERITAHGASEAEARAATRRAMDLRLLEAWDFSKLVDAVIEFAQRGDVDRLDLFKAALLARASTAKV